MKKMAENERAEFDRLHGEYLDELTRLCISASDYTAKPSSINRATLARAAVSYAQKFAEVLGHGSGK